MSAVSFDMVQKYLDRHFLSLTHVAQNAGCAPADARAWTKSGCMMQPSYLVSRDGRIDSAAFGGHLFESFANTPGQSAYFASYAVAWARRIMAIAQDVPAAELPTRLRTTFAGELRTAVQRLGPQSAAWCEAFDAAGQLRESAFAGAAKDAWQTFLSGAYGVCLHAATAENIAIKAHCVESIRRVLEHIEMDAGVDDHGEQLRPHVDTLDALLMPFAPHEYPASSRKRWVVDVRNRFELEPNVASLPQSPDAGERSGRPTTNHGSL
jgi:hypothetical protein